MESERKALKNHHRISVGGLFCPHLIYKVLIMPLSKVFIVTENVTQIGEPLCFTCIIIPPN